MGIKKQKEVSPVRLWKPAHGCSFEIFTMVMENMFATQIELFPFPDKGYLDNTLPESQFSSLATSFFFSSENDK